MNPSYSHVADHLSDLASFGARAPVIGILAIATFGVADAVAARVVISASRTAAVALILAGVAGLVIAAARIHCSEGAAGCPRSVVDDSTWTDVLHGQAVVVNALAFFVAMMACAAGRVGAGRAAWWRPTVVVLAVLGLGFLSQAIGEGAVGAWQRGWLLTNSVLLLLVTARTPAGTQEGRG